jgi:hypothetical protein
MPHVLCSRYWINHRLKLTHTSRQLHGVIVNYVQGHLYLTLRCYISGLSQSVTHKLKSYL